MVNPQFLFPMIYEFVIYFFTLLMVIVIGRRYREKRKPVVRFMFFFALMMSTGILMAAFSRVLRYTALWEVRPGVFIEFLTFTISFIALGNIFMLAFCLEVFYKGPGSRWGIFIMAIYSVATAWFILFAIYTGLFVVDLTELIWGVAIVLSLFVYGTTMIAALRLAVRMDKGPDRVSAVMISISPLSILCVFVMFFLDRIFGGNFTPFYYSGWVFVIISMVFLYIGVIRPKWAFKKQ
ncbi:MAG: hypothetical protein JW776_08455 [Candidatus Lokiarchaeota archaeon]|nr:hypothetical protein [Candidatus Lokiarchaeota archaeon]